MSIRFSRVQAMAKDKAAIFFGRRNSCHTG